MFISEPESIELLLNGEIVALPTETVFGIFVLTANKLAVENLLDLKKRTDKHLCIYVNMDYKFDFDIPEEYLKFLPGPLTIIKNTIGYRISSNKIIQNIISKIGPLIGTSANLTGYPPITEAKYLNFKIPSINEKCSIGIESTVLNLDTNTILRDGAINLINQNLKHVSNNPKYFKQNSKRFFLNSNNKGLFNIGFSSECDFILDHIFSNFWTSVSEGYKSTLDVNFNLNLDDKIYLHKLVKSYINRLV